MIILHNIREVFFLQSFQDIGYERFLAIQKTLHPKKYAFKAAKYFQQIS